jgi:hypothetical protein
MTIDRATFGRVLLLLRRRYDAELLRVLDLSPRDERRLIDAVVGEGVYFPRGFTPWVPLHEYLSDEYRRSTVGYMRRRYRPVRDPVILAGLDATLEAFAEDAE